jgi:hypothetical protein
VTTILDDAHLMDLANLRQLRLFVPSPALVALWLPI